MKYITVIILFSVPVILLTFLMSSIAHAQAGSPCLEVPWGNDTEGVGFINMRTQGDKEGQDPPAGPLSFAVREKDGSVKIYLASTFSGRIDIFEDGKKIRSIDLKSCGLSALINDISVDSDDFIYIVDSTSNSLLKLSQDGKILLRLEGPNQEKKFLQLHMVEVSNDGLIYAGDMGEDRIYIFDRDGKFLREMEWNLNGFALDKSGALVWLDYEEGKGYTLKRTEKNGSTGVVAFAGEPECVQAAVVSSLDDGSAIIRLVLPSDMNARLFRIFPDGTKSLLASVKMPVSTRMAAVAGNRLIVNSSDPERAPEGLFRLDVVEIK